LADPHPHLVVSLTAMRITVRPTDMRIAAGQLIRAGTLTGDSGTKTRVQTSAMTIATSGNQNSQW
jgi:hypothetical protein